MNILRRIAMATVWAPHALNAEPKKYRPLLRVWIPLFNVIVIWCGINAAVYGSQMLDAIFGNGADLLGILFSTVGFICLIGVSFPALWIVEVLGKCLVLGMLFAYMWALILFPSQAQLMFSSNPNWFIVTMLFLGFPLACFRLGWLATEEFDRRVAKRAAELRQEGESDE